jgi:mono/diheme cytochrome c family protein
LVVAAACSQPPTPSGSDLFAANCAACHGRYADGFGPAAADVSRPVPDLRYLAVRNGGVFPRARVTEAIDGRAIVDAHGDRQMPVWGDAFTKLDEGSGSANARTDTKIQALVDYLATIQQSK